MKRLFLSLIATIFLLLFSYTLPAGEIVANSDGSTTIKLVITGMPTPSATDVNSRAELTIIKTFIKKFPEIFKKKYAEKYKSNPQKYGNFNWDKVNIQLRNFSGITVSGVENDLLAIAGNMAPDVLYVNCRKSDNYIQNGFLKPLDPFIANLTKEERRILFEERVHEKLWPVIKRRGADGQVKIWALPYGGNPSGKVLMYRKDIFDKHDIPYPDGSWNWDKMYEVCKKVTDPAKGIYGILLGRGKKESWYWINYLWSAGGDVMKEQNPGQDDWICTFGSDEGVTALDFYIKLSAERWVDKNGIVRRGYAFKDSAKNTKWERGEIAMSINTLEDNTLNSFNSELYGIAPIPMGPTGLRGSELNSRMLGIFGGIKNQVILDAAWEYLHYRDSREAMKIRTDILVDGGMAQFVVPRYLNMFGYSDLVSNFAKEMNELYELSLKTSHPEPYGRNSNFAYDQMSIPIQKAEALALADKLSDNPKVRHAQLKKLLQESEDLANEVMLGKVSQEERSKRRVIAWIALAAIGIAYFFVFRKIFKIFTPTDSTGKSKGWQFKKYFWAYLLLVPAVATIFFWSYLPLARGSIMAFQSYKILGDSIWVGVDNFGDLLVDASWWQSVWNAFRYSLLVISLTFLPPVILAILLQEVPHGKILFRVIYYLPAVITGLVTMLLWKQFYEPSEFGVLNRLVLAIPAGGFIIIGLILATICCMFARRLIFCDCYWQGGCFILAGLVLFSAAAAPSFGVLFPGNETWQETLSMLVPRLLECNKEPFRWLFNPNTAMLACVIPMVWAGMGPGCLIYLAALKGIPDDFYEAADIDGATFIDKILFVVFPTLKALVVINFVGVFISSWYASTGNILVMTGGDAATKTETAGLFIWYKAFTYLNFGPATAAAWMLAFILIGFTVYQLRILAKVEFRAGGKK